MSIAVGVELTQRQTSVCVIEGDHREDGVHFLVRHLERFATRLAYPKVADRLNVLFLKLKLRGNKSLPIFIDESEVGPPVVDLIQKGFRPTRLERVSFNHGQQPPEYAATGLILGKGWLVSHLKVLLQTERLHLPKSPDADTLADDLASGSPRSAASAHRRGEGCD